MRQHTLVLLAALSLVPVMAQLPDVVGGPVNAASYVPGGLPSGGIAQGSLFIVKGNGLGNAGTAVASAFPLQTGMNNTSIRVMVGGTTVNARMIYVVAGRPGAPDQLAAILPSDAPIGTGTLQVIYRGADLLTRTSPAVPIRVVANSFGMFTRNQNGSGPAIVQNFISQADQPTNGLLESAQVGQTEILWGTGLGAVNAAAEINGPAPGDLPLNVEVYVGGKQANVTYRGRSGCCAGIDQIVFTVPAGLEGCYVSILVRVNGVVSTAGTMSIAPGKVCAEPSSLSAADIAKIQKTGAIGIGNIQLDRLRANLNIPGQGVIQGDIDFGGGKFRRYASSTDVMASLSGSLTIGQGTPTPGSCVIQGYSFTSNDPFDAAFPDLPDFVGASLDAGATLRLNGPIGSKQLPRQRGGGYGGDPIAGGIAALGLPVLPPYLEPGTITVDNGAGTAQLGAFTSSLVIPANTATWSNQRPGGNVPRSQDLTLTWSGGGPGELVLILGASADKAISAGAQFICVERAQAGTFTVPSWVLSALPASGVVAGVPVGFLTFGTSLPQPSRFTATGLDLGYFNWSTRQVTNVVFQ